MAAAALVNLWEDTVASVEENNKNLSGGYFIYPDYCTPDNPYGDPVYLDQNGNSIVTPGGSMVMSDPNESYPIFDPEPGKPEPFEYGEPITPQVPPHPPAGWDPSMGPRESNELP